MARNERRIDWSYFLDARNFVKGNKDAQRSLSTTEKAMGTLKKAFGAVAVAFGAREVVQWAGDAIQLAAAAEEVDSKFQAVFGSAKDLKDALREWGDVAGVTETKGKDLAATFGNLAQAQGISKDVTEDLTLDVAKLAGDLASFNDADPSQVFFNLNKALLTTEREGMAQYGIKISEVEVKQRALELAVADGRTEATKADRAMASYAIAAEQAGKAVGDLERTSDSTANRQRRLQASLKETQEEIGRDLLPVYESFLQVSESLLPVLETTAGAFGVVAGAVDETIGPISDLVEEGERLKAMFAGLGEVLAFIASPIGTLASKIDTGQNAMERMTEALNEMTEAAQYQAEYFERIRDPYGLAAAGAVGLAGANTDAAGGVATLTEALKDQTDYLGKLDAALSGDLFAKYRRFIELQGLAAGGRNNPDYDRGEDYTNAQTVYNSANGIS